MIKKEAPDSFLNSCLFFAVLFLTAAVYSRVFQHDFILLDDPVYIFENPVVLSGLSWNGIVWAFTRFHDGNWFPLTWITHMADCRFFGFAPGLHHMTNAAIHILNTALLYTLLKKMTGEWGKSLFVAALFALHPLHVESVAWASERKDVLCAFFWLLTSIAYVDYARKGKGYLWVGLFFLLGIMSKSMIVTLPFVFLLLDVWPLGRMGEGRFFSLLKEKIPLLALSFAACVMAALAQQSGHFIKNLSHVPFPYRLGNAFLSYARYLRKVILPSDLSVFYPYHLSTVPPAGVLAAFLFILTVSFFALRQMKKRPYFFTGWFWYLGTLVPVIGLVQIGGQAMADRYTYLPLIGIFMMMAWGIPELLPSFKTRKLFWILFSSFAVLIFTGLTYRQIGYWENTETLFKHALTVTQGNGVAHANLADFYSRTGRFEEAIEHYEKSNAIREDLALLNNLGNAYFQMGKLGEASGAYEYVIAKDPGNFISLNNLGMIASAQKRFPEAENFYRRSAEANPDFIQAQAGLIHVLIVQGKLEEARERMAKAGPFFAAQGEIAKVLQAEYKEALRLSSPVQLPPG